MNSSFGMFIENHECSNFARDLKYSRVHEHSKNAFIAYIYFLLSIFKIYKK